MMENKVILDGSSIRTHSGIYIDIFEDFDINLLKIEDIAHALSLLCRYNGQINQFYSVAEHCIWVSHHLANEHKLAGLLHDCAESICSDIARPIRDRLKQHQQLEHHILIKLSKKFEFQYPFHKCVTYLDHVALQYEWETFVINDTKKTKSVPCKSPKEVEKQFLKLFYELSANKK